MAGMSQECAAARDYLRTYRLMEYSVDSRLEQLRRLRSKLYSAAAKPLSDMPRGGPRADWTDLSIQCIELENDLAGEIQDMRARQRDIRNAISAVPGERWQSVLNLRYIGGFSWDMVAMKMGLDSKYVLQLHREALENVRIPEGA